MESERAGYPVCVNYGSLYLSFVSIVVGTRERGTPAGENGSVW